MTFFGWFPDEGGATGSQGRQAMDQFLGMFGLRFRPYISRFQRIMPPKEELLLPQRFLLSEGLMPEGLPRRYAPRDPHRS